MLLKQFISKEENGHHVTIISVTFMCLTNQGKLSAWQKLMSLLFSLCLLSFSFPSFYSLYLNSKLPQSLFTTKCHLLVLRCQDILSEKQLLKTHFLSILIIATLILFYLGGGTHLPHVEVPGIKPMWQLRPVSQLQQPWILNPLYHKGTSIATMVLNNSLRLFFSS